MRALAVALGALVLGAVVGLASVVVYAWWWGLALGAAATLATLIALPPRPWARVPYAAGWVILLALGMSTRPEGDFLIAGSLPGYALIAVGLVLIVAAIGTSAAGR